MFTVAPPVRLPVHKFPEFELLCRIEQMGEVECVSVSTLWAECLLNRLLTQRHGLRYDVKFEFIFECL